MPDDGRLTAMREAVGAVRQTGIDPQTPGGAILLGFLLDGWPPSRRSASLAQVLGLSPAAERALEPAAAEPLDDAPVERLARWMGVEAIRVEDVFELTESAALIRVPARRLPVPKAHRQRVLVLLRLAAERIGYERMELPGADVNATCADYGCMDQNLPQNVKSRAELVSRRGRRGKSFYRITQQGMQRAQDLFQQLFMTDEVLRV